MSDAFPQPSGEGDLPAEPIGTTPGDQRLAALGVHRIAIPIPFREAGGPVNVLLVREPEGGCTLIDAGLFSSTAEQALRAAMAQLGFAFRDVGQVLLTHGHVDHYGLAARIASESEAKVRIHPRDREKATDGMRMLRQGGPYATYLRSLGLSDEQVAAVRKGGEGAQRFGQAVPEAAMGPDLMDGERLRVGGLELEVVPCPGHTPGLVCLWDATNRVLFANDHLLERVSPNPLIEVTEQGGRIEKFRALPNYFASIRRVREMPVEWVVPGHMEPFQSHVAVIDRLLGFYEKRQGKLLALLDSGPRSAVGLAEALWGASHPGSLFLRLSEVLGNLEVMEELGRIRSWPSDAGLMFGRV